MSASLRVAVCLISFTTLAHAQLWDAGSDLRTNELSAQELTNPNFAVPEWSYGYRSSIASTALTLFSGTGDHRNSFGGTPDDVQGWTLAGNVPALGVNVGASPVIFDNGSGPLDPLLPGEIIMHPSGLDVVARWTAPSAGDYTIDTHWDDMDPYGGGGAAGYLVINGSIVTGGAWPNGSGSGFTDSDRVVTLAAGDLVDFVLDPVGDFGFDSTRFSATIAVPEASPALFGMSVVLAIFFRRQRRAT